MSNSAHGSLPLVLGNGRSGSSVARSPSHESFSPSLQVNILLAEKLPNFISTAVNVAQSKPSRPGSSCSTQALLVVPFDRLSNRRLSALSRLTSEVLSEEQADAIRSCGALSTEVFGLMKSFSTTDLPNQDLIFPASSLRRCMSEVAMFGGVLWNARLDLPSIRRLDETSRSCSTWVAVGDPQVSCTSQLPSPQAAAESVIGSNAPSITPLDFVLSFNKRCRQMYIRRRLFSTYRALERLSRSQLDLTNSIQTGGLEVSPHNLTISNLTSQLGDKITVSNSTGCNVQSSSSDFNFGDNSIVKSESSTKLKVAWDKLTEDISTLTVKEIEQQKGKPLTKYERNIMIFNWLQELDQTDGDPFQESVSTTT